MKKILKNRARVLQTLVTLFLIIFQNTAPLFLYVQKATALTAEEAGDISNTYSVVTANPTNIPADNTSQSLITVSLRDSDNLPISEETITLTSDRVGDTVSVVSNITDNNGDAFFHVKSNGVGTSTYTARVDSVGSVLSDTATVSYDAVIPVITPTVTPTPVIPADDNPSVPTNGLPNGTVINTNDFYFTWDPSTDNSATLPFTYEFQSSLNPAQVDGVLTTNVWHSGILTSPTIHSTGAPDGTWYWQVRAIDADGHTSNWSTIWTVTLDTQAPAVPALVSPADGAFVKPTGLILDWTDSTDPNGAVTYYYQSAYDNAVGANNSLLHTIYNSGVLNSSQINASASADAAYYWQVRACDSVNNCSAWSGPWKVTIDHVAPVTTASGYDSLWHNSDVTVTLNCTDSLSGCAETYYSVDGAAYLAGTSVTLTDDGEHQVMFYSVDRAGNIESTTSSVPAIVRIDKIGPVLHVPGNITAEATSAAGRLITYTNATATDALSGVSSVSCNPISGQVFPLGDTTVTCTALDNAGNTATGTFTVSVVDTTRPSISAPIYVRQEATSPAGNYVTYTATATDIVDGTVPVICNIPSGSLFPIGRTNVRCSATDSHGNTANRTVIIFVLDTQAPVFGTTPDILGVEATSRYGASVTFNVTAVDNIDGEVSVVCIPPSGYTFPIGRRPVLCMATDSHFNTAFARFYVQVVDTTAPTITVPENITVESYLPGGGANVTFETSATDIVNGDVTVTCTPTSGSFFALGTTTVTCTAADSAGNVGTATFDVNVIDTVAPTSTLRINANLDETKNIEGTAGWFNAGWYESYNNVDLRLTSGDQTADFTRYQLLAGDVACPTHGTANGYSAPQADNSNEKDAINSQADGVYTFCYYAEDLSGNTESTIHKELLKIDNTNGTYTIDSASGNLSNGVYYVNGDTFTINATFDDANAGYARARFDLYNADADHNCTSYIGWNEDDLPATSNHITRSLTKSGLADGNYCMRVWMYDAVQNKTWAPVTGSHTVKFTVDNTAPTSTVRINANLDETKNIEGTAGWFNAGWYESYNNVDLRLTSGDPVVDFMRYQIIPGNVTCPTYGTANGYSAPQFNNANLRDEINAQSDGVYTLCFYGEDLAGNTESSINTQLLKKDDISGTYSIDSVNGNLVNNVYYVDTNSVTINATFDDVNAGYARARFDLYNADADHNCTSYVGWNQDDLYTTSNHVTRSLTKSGLADGNYCMRIWMYDAVQNKTWNSVSGSNTVKFTIDTTSPTVTDIESQTLNEGDEIPSVTVTGNDNIGGVKACYTLESLNGSINVTTPSCTEMANGTSHTWNVNSIFELPSIVDTALIPEDTYTFTYWTEDLTGNKSEEKTVTYTVNNVAPYYTGDGIADVVINEGDSVKVNVELPTSSDLTLTAASTSTVSVAFRDPSTLGGSDDRNWSASFNFDTDHSTTFSSNDTFTFNNFGVYTVTVKVTEGTEFGGEGASGTMRFNVVVNNVAPTVSMSAVQNANKSYTFTADGLGGNAPLSYNWSGSCSGTTQSVTTGTAAGTYTCTVTVTDADGDTATATLSRVIAAVTNPANDDGDTNTNTTVTPTTTPTVTPTLNPQVLGLMDQQCDTKYVASGYAFVDANNNGLKDDGEKFVANVQAGIYVGDSLLKSITTDGEGKWNANLCPGDYKLKVTSSSLPSNVKIVSDSKDFSVKSADANANINIVLSDNTNSFNWWLLALGAVIIVGLLYYIRRRSNQTQVYK